PAGCRRASSMASNTIRAIYGYSSPSHKDPLVERYDGVSLNCTCPCDLALTVEAGKLGLGTLAGERNRAKLVECRADLGQLTAQSVDLGGMPVGHLVQFLAHAGEHGVHAIGGVKRLTRHLASTVSSVAVRAAAAWRRACP